MDTGQVNGRVGRVSLLKPSNNFSGSLHFGFIMHHCEKHSAPHGGSWRLLRKHGRSQSTIFWLVRHLRRPQQYLGCSMRYCFCSLKPVFYVHFRLAQSYFQIRQTWIFNYFMWKMCYVQPGTVISAGKLTNSLCKTCLLRPDVQGQPLLQTGFMSEL